MKLTELPEFVKSSKLDKLIRMLFKAWLILWALLISPCMLGSLPHFFFQETGRVINGIFQGIAGAGLLSAIIILLGVFIFWLVNLVKNTPDDIPNEAIDQTPQQPENDSPNQSN